MSLRGKRTLHAAHEHLTREGPANPLVWARIVDVFQVLQFWLICFEMW